MDNSELEEKKAKIFEFISDETFRPMKRKALAELLMVPKEDRQKFSLVLDELEKEGKITYSENGKIMRLEGNTRAGTFSATRRGFGFVIVENEDDIFIPEGHSKDAMDGDNVLVQLTSGEKGGRRREGMVTRVIEHKNNRLVGTFMSSQNFGFVVPDDKKIAKDIYISKGKTKGAVDGHKVVVRLTSYGDEEKSPEGEVIEILGHRNDPGIDILSIIRSLGLPEEFPEQVMRQVEKLPSEVAEMEMEGRTDIRQLPTVTIDGEDAKDLDDAITLSKTDDGIYHLGVHIADVTHYVTEQTPLDKEAILRGTSVYLVDRVIPMLPHKLSNGICSLNARVDRLALSCFMDFNRKGELINHNITESVIRVDERMSYTDVNDILTIKSQEVCTRYENFIRMFSLMEELAETLRRARKEKGSIDFDLPECKVLMDDEGKAVDIVPYDRNVATRIIEEFMLAANQVVAEDYFWMEVPFLYRTHEDPDLEKMRELAMLTRGFGYHLKVGNDEMHPRELQKLMESIEGTKEEAFISRLTLRSMKRAKYSVTNDGHFGLAMKYYTHFTSPIRRYPDLQIHRIIKEQMRGGLSDKREEHYSGILPNIANETSRLERRADEAEREVEKMKKVEYMERHIGEVYEGLINGVTSWGMYVELPNTVEGMVRLTDMMDDDYKYDELNYSIIGRRTGKMYRLGEKVKVIVARVDRIASTIDFELYQEDEEE